MSLKLAQACEYFDNQVNTYVHAVRHLQSALTGVKSVMMLAAESSDREARRLCVELLPIVITVIAENERMLKDSNKEDLEHVL